jgi:CRP-like cAMP-binding protein
MIRATASPLGDGGSGVFAERAPCELVRLLRVDPDLARHLTPEDAERAMNVVTTRHVAVDKGPFVPSTLLGAGDSAFALRVVDGLVAREIGIEGQPTMRLLGPGDLIREMPLPAGTLTTADTYTALAPTRLVVLDDRLLAAIRHLPRIVTALVERLVEQSDATLLQMAVSQLPRVEERLTFLFGLLAERWGVVTPAGVVVPLKITHEALGHLIGARRPTVTLALRALAGDGRVARRADGCWLLRTTDIGPAPRPALGEHHVTPVAGAQTG